MSIITDQKKYSGKWFSPNDIEQIKQTISNNSQASRALLSRLVCQEFNWKKIDGNLKEMSCRVAISGMGVPAILFFNSKLRLIGDRKQIK